MTSESTPPSAEPASAGPASASPPGEESPSQLKKFLESPRSYALVVPTVNACVAATGLFIPWFMEPVSFGQFILIS
ncbi:hypothetical protein, partial [uncultured Nisaea sp.]|uniref:hypothetical protein n=1 Tax=uncultured Nisaea sp. TaxID=538215 RepID=UPI0030EDA5A3